MSENYFREFNSINFGDKVRPKNGLSYLPWAIAWGALKEKYPLSTYTVYENENGWCYFTDGRTCWVKTGVTVTLADGSSVEHVESLAIMDHRNQSIPLEKVTSTDVVKSIQRCLTKACARHGIGLYVYAGEESSEELQKMRREVIATAKKLITGGVARDVVNQIVANENNGNPNPNAIISVEACDAVLTAMSAVQLSEKKKEKSSK